MKRFPLSTSSMRGVGLILIVVAFGMAWYQYPEYFRTGRVIVAYSSERGNSYGSKFALIYPVLELILGIAFFVSTMFRRIEITDETITAFNALGKRTTTLPWPEVQAFRRDGTALVSSSRNYTKTVNRYAVEGPAGKIQFLEITPNLKDLIHQIRIHLPPSASNDLPDPT